MNYGGMINDDHSLETLGKFSLGRELEYLKCVVMSKSRD